MKEKGGYFGAHFVKPCQAVTGISDGNCVL